jgi:3-methyladenine DNA glycosylase AlkD
MILPKMGMMLTDPAAKTLASAVGREMRAVASQSFANFSRKLLRVGEDSGRIVLGCSLPNLRKICGKYLPLLELEDTVVFLRSNVHEYRQFALLAMIEKFKTMPATIAELYLANIAFIDNWDLVDVSAPKIIGGFYPSSDGIFDRLARDANIWANRIAMVATLPFIRADDFSLTLRLAEMFMGHGSHFLHKASGWMLREVGKRDGHVLVKFLTDHWRGMPRIMLRYACERLPADLKAKFFPGKF